MVKRYGLWVHLGGALTARVGDEMSGPALLLAGLALTGTAAEASALLAGIAAAAALGGPALGPFLDRVDRPGRLLAGALAGYAAGLVLVAGALGRLPFAAILAVAVCTGLAGPALSAGWTAQLPRAAGDGEGLDRANALDAMTFCAAGLAGPVLAGGAAELLGAPAAVVLSAVLVALALPAAWVLPARSTGARHPRPASAATVPASVVRAVAGRPALARATLSSVVCAVAQGIVTVCVPLLGARVLGGSGRGAMLLSCTALTALAATAVLARFPRVLSPGTVMWASALVLAGSSALALCPHPAALVTAFLVAGVGEGPQLAALFAIRHREAPEGLRGRVFTTGASLKITGFALGAAVGGPLASWSLAGALVAAAGVSVLAAVVFLAVPYTARACFRGRPPAGR
ncbi:MFS transporter [Streptomyces sp.]|uniref:MFS transporter n=1 Tax=Streptomyces sp. TaxID=1931 RepID=UPI0028109E30|nr:MFS transporter [Streptomyces sp.]